MNKAVCLMAFLVASVGGSGVADAQDEHPAGEVTDPAAIVALHQFARCVVERSPRAAESLIGRDYGSLDYGDVHRRIEREHGDCAMGEHPAFSGMLFAGGLAEALLERDHAPATLPALFAYDPSLPAIQARNESEVMALCTVRRAPRETAALLATDPESPAEAAAVRAVAAALPDCVRRGQPVRLNRPGLRALLALAALKLARQHDSPGPMVGGN